MKNGKRVIKYDDDSVCAILFFKDDKKDGLCEWYHKNGNLEERSYWKDNKVDGEMFSYYSDGTFFEHKFWENGIDITKQVLEKRELLKRIEKL